MDRKAEIDELVPLIKAQGFRVWVAKSGTYGFYTNKEETRVVYFQAGLSGYEMSGCYRSTCSGSGWRLGILIDTTFETLQAYLNATPPSWATRFEPRPVHLLTLAEYLNSRGAKCSHYKEVI